ncbi:flavodoxin [Thermophilibacter provencensis]|uniref:flavodoxin n=1 Tax=Thermophilibacter provencensis TaxID=1852386 RepID=UPI0009FB9170|nr:flavodoxin [Thermophilibacter provencensis]
MNTARTLSRRSFLMGAAAIAPLSLLLAGCSNDEEEAAPAQAAPEQAETATDDSSAADAAPAGGNVLVAYYSAQGHTEAVAQTIADELGADLFEVTPAEPYSDDDLNWTDDNSRVTQEHEDESLRDVELEQVTPDGWEDYDTVLVGYPIWWGIAAWPIDNFISGNDWNGKTVIPFCTSSSSGLGQSGELLAEAAGGGNWQEGQRFSSSADESEIRDWVSGLGLA